MNVSFVICSVLITTIIALCIGTAVKFWMYGVRDLFLLASPLVVILAFFAVPLIAFNILLFHPEKLDERMKQKQISLSLKSKSLTIRLKFSVFVTFMVIKLYPMFAGAIADALSSAYANKPRVFNPLNSVPIFIQEVILDKMGSSRLLKKMV